MNKLFCVFLMCYLCLVVFLVIDVGANSEDSLRRPKRYLSFANTSHFYFRLNFKDNLVPWNQLFARALGFGINYDEPPDSFHAYHHFNRRAVLSQLQLLLDRIGLSGFHCVRRVICELNSISEPSEIYHRILKILFRKKSSITEKWHNVNTDDCHLSVSLCPLSVLDVSRYTDII